MVNCRKVSGNLESGFTLIEIIVSMAIFAIITGSLLGNYFSSFTKGRDVQRKSDLVVLQKALEAYFNDHRAYPTALPEWGASFGDGTSTYLVNTPKDPKDPAIHYTYSSDGILYKIYACLENTKDSKITAAPGFGSTNCGSCGNGYGTNCNYGVSSTNTTP